MRKETTRGYKVFNPDFTCRDFKYEVGKQYEHKGIIDICSEGFHFCKELKDCFNYYSFDFKNPVCEIEASGEIINRGDKSVTSNIKILRQLTLEDILLELNLYCSDNSGSSNSGSDNSGSYNRGSDNSGIFNFSSNNVGVLNYNSFLGTKENCYCFNQETGMSLFSFVKKYLKILREIKRYNFNNVSKLPNYTEEKWELISKHI